MVRHTGGWLVPLAGLVLIGGLACARVPPAHSTTAPSPLVCPTGYGVTVQNNTPDAVDVWQQKAGSDEIVGTVSGRTTSDLLLTGGEVVNWRWPPENPPRFHGNVDVTLHMHCR